MKPVRLATVNVNCSKNKRSLFNLLDDLKLFILENEISILALTETDLECQKLAQDFKIEGFTTFSQISSGKVRSLLLVKEVFNAIDISKPTALPTVSVELNLKGQRPLRLSCVYRQWSTYWC